MKPFSFCLFSEPKMCLRQRLFLLPKAGMVNMTPGELQQRQKFLSEQRDQLLAMKKKARAKQLGDAVKSQPQRPRSGRAARNAMDQACVTSANEEEEKKMAMRHAIANKLKQEVIKK